MTHHILFLYQYRNSFTRGHQLTIPVLVHPCCVQNEKVPSMAQEQMHALLVRGSVQERLAAEGKCLVPRKLVDAVASDSSVKSNALVSRDLGRFVASLQAGR